MTERQPYKRDLEDLEMQSGHKWAEMRLSCIKWGDSLYLNKDRE